MKNFMLSLNHSDRIIYFWLFLFILPIPIAIFSHDTSVRNFNYVWAFLFLIYFFKNQLILKIDNIVFSGASLRIFFCGVLLSFNYSALAQYYGFHAGGFDFSIFDSMLQEAVRGNWGYSTFVGYYHFATHQHYPLLLLLPIYYILPYPIILPITLMISLWFAGILLWKISRIWLNEFWSFMLVLSFYLSPHLEVSTTCFTPELFYPCIVFLIAYAYIKNMNILFIVSVLLFLSIKEEAILYGIGFALWLFINKRYNKMLIVMFLMAVFAAANFLIVSPYFLSKSHLLAPPTLKFWSNYGNTKLAIATYILQHPISVTMHMFSYNSGFWSTYTPFLFIPLLSLPIIMISALPLALYLSAVDTSGLYLLNSYYPAVLISLCFLGMICFLIKYKDKTRQILALLVLITAPLWGTGAQGFYHINLKNINDFNQVLVLLKTKYTNLNICPGSAIYPHIKIDEFRYLGPVSATISAQDFITQKNCIVVFSEFGDNMPYTDYVNYIATYAKTHNNCSHIGSIYYCNNYAN